MIFMIVVVIIAALSQMALISVFIGKLTMEFFIYPLKVNDPLRISFEIIKIYCVL